MAKLSCSILLATFFIGAVRSECTWWYFSTSVFCTELGVLPSFPSWIINSSSIVSIAITGNTQINKIQAFAFNSSPSMQNITLANLGIQSLDSASFQGLPILKFLNLSRNSISWIELGTFMAPSRAYSATLDLSHNQITSLSAGVFSDFWSNIILSRNQISSIADQTFSSFSSSLSLDLSWNLLTSLSGSIFSDAHSLQFVGSNINLINQLSSQNLTLLSTNLSSDQVGALVTSVLSGNNWFLYMSDSSINAYTFWDISLLTLGAGVPQSRILSGSDERGYATPITGYEFQSGGQNIVQNYNLLSFFLSVSQLTSVSARAYNGSVHIIYLSRNRMSSFADYSFSNVKGLFHLNLSSTQLASLSAYSYNGLSNLTTINLAINSDQSNTVVIDNAAKEVVLDALRLVGNPWQCDCSLAWLRSGSVGQIVDGATCQTPTLTFGQYIVCFNISGTCSIDGLTISNQVTTLCNITNGFAGLPTPTWSPPTTGAFTAATPTHAATYQRVTGSSSSYVSNVSPLFGPVAGGTLVTVTGQGLNYSNTIVALFPVNFTMHGIIDLLPVGFSIGPKFDTLIAITPQVDSSLPSEAVTHLAVELIISGRQVDLLSTNRYFDYRPNPNITSVSPTWHLMSGGTQITLSGTSMNSAAFPFIIVTTVVERSNNSNGTAITVNSTSNSKTCFGNATYTAVTCLMPPVPLPPDFQAHLNVTSGQGGSSPVTMTGNGTMSITGPNGKDKATVYVGAIFDGDRDYENFTASLPNFPIRFYLPPSISSSYDIIDFNPRRQNFIEILGKNMELGAQLVDYNVSIGYGQCVGTSLTDNVLSCQPPFNEPLVDINSNNWCAAMKKLNPIMVRVGFSDPILYACIRYVSDSVNVGLAVGLAVGLGVPFIALIFVGIVFLIRRKNNTATETSNVYRTTLRKETENTAEEIDNKGNLYNTTLRKENVNTAGEMGNIGYSANLRQMTPFDSDDTRNQDELPL